MAEKIMTLHPEGKQGVNIDQHKYDTIKGTIIDALTTEGEQSFGALRDAVEQKLGDNFDGSVSWYYTTVKLDLEARGILERIPGSSPQRIRLVK